MNFSRSLIPLLLLAACGRAQAMEMQMPGALGPQPMQREASGTSWQPEAAPMPGRQGMRGDWMWMLDASADLIADHQGGLRGDDAVIVPGMFMAMAQGPAGAGTLGTRVMLSPDPAMGPRGYPLLLQTGETANGRTPLVDRQHPHDFFMELAASYSLPLRDGSLFGYAGLPGEPALGPPTFMHRASGALIPEAPLTHHWLDSTHVTFGVLTLGATTARWKLDASVFNGREPDQQRWNLETRRLDSYSGRLSFNPSSRWSLQASHGFLASPEQLEPEVSVHRTTVSAAHTAPLADGHWSTTLALGVNHEGGHDFPGALLESTRQAGGGALFARLDWLRTEHLLAPPAPGAGRTFAVEKFSLGGMHRIASAGAFDVSAGGLLSLYGLPAGLRDRYGAQPLSAMVFLRAALREP